MMNKTLGALLIMGTVGVGSAAGLSIARAAPTESPMCEQHVEHLDRPFGVQHIPGPDYEIYIAACAVGPGNGGSDFKAPEEEPPPPPLLP